MKFLALTDVRQWYEDKQDLTTMTRSIGRKMVDGDYLEEVLGLPVHLRFALERAAANDQPVSQEAFSSLPFYSLCRGLFLPLSYMDPAKAAQVFGLQVAAPPDSAAKEELLAEFLSKDCGLSLEEKLGCILGDPFLGRRSTFKRDSMLSLLKSLAMIRHADMLDELTRVGDVAVLFSQSRKELRCDPPLTASEVLAALRYLPDAGRTEKFDVLRSLLTRCGKVEAYFLAKMLLRKAGFGFDYQGPLLARIISEHFGVDGDAVAHAIALTDVFKVVRVLEEDGEAGLRSIQLQPLVAVKPSLAAGSTDDIEKFPVWVERKYDGIRLMLHKSTDMTGSTLCGAYTRSRGDWLEMINGLDQTIRAIPGMNFILDGELFGTVLEMDSVRPASVYEVYANLQGQGSLPVNLKFAAFDILYLNGRDITDQPLKSRRQTLTQLLAPLSQSQLPLPIPVSLSEGQMAGNKDDVNRLYQHFRNQGYEGIITKDIDGPYRIAVRDASWMKRKPQITLDLALIGGVYAVTTKEKAGLFGSYVIAAKDAENGTFVDVGDVAGVDQVRDREIQNEIVRDGLMTGARIERPSSSGVRPGIELRPSIVATVKFEGITRDTGTGRLSLRDPKIAMIRSDKSAAECDTTEAIRQLYLKQRVS